MDIDTFAEQIEDARQRVLSLQPPGAASQGALDQICGQLRVVVDGLGAAQRRLCEQQQQLSASTAQLEAERARASRGEPPADAASPGQRERFIEQIAEASPDIIYVYDLAENRTMYSNHERAALQSYAPDQIHGPTPALMHPDDMRQLSDYRERLAAARDGEVVAFEYRVRHADGCYRWLLSREVVFARHADGTPSQALGIAQDITKRKQIEEALQRSNAALHQRIEELSALNRIAQTVATVTHLPAAMQIVGQMMLRVFSAAAISIELLDDGQATLTTLAHISAAQREPPATTTRLSDHPIARQVLARRQTLIISHEQAASGPHGVQEQLRARGLLCLMAIPLWARGALIGIAGVGIDQPERVFSPAQVVLAQTIAASIAAAISNARLFAEEQQQRLMAESLRETAAALTSSLDQETVLRTIFDQLRRVVRYDGATISLHGDGALVIAEAVGRSVRYTGHRMPLAQRRPAVQVFLEKRPQIIGDTADHPDWVVWARADADLAPHQRVELSVRSWMGVPLIIGTTAIGVLTVNSSTPQSYHAPDMRALQAFASPAAIAIDNARRYRQAHESAADEERRRLARDLHDSVTQALSSVSLVADVLPQLWESDPARASQGIETLQRVTRGALAEMRTLLLELRPAALAETRLDAAIGHLTTAITTQAPVEVAVSLEPMPELAPEVQLALYRMAQEGLHNVVKHAQARHIEVSLRAVPAVAAATEPAWRGEIAIHIADDGRGFDDRQLSPDRLGLGIMRERAAAIGARLKISSAPGRGTQLTISWRGGAASSRRSL